jgi:dTDP-glucose 4,6-dehydratase
MSSIQFRLPQGRYLITGGAGFIGSHITEALLEQGSEVVVVDNFITGRRENIRPFLGNSRFTLMEQDLVNPLEISGGVAGIFHMASPASPVDYAKYPIETLHVGSLGSDNILKVALAKKCPILVASTSEVYGDPLQHPQTESYWGNVNPIGPRGCYDESKRYLEAITMAYHRVHKVDTRIIRIFNTYGPRMRTNDGRVVPNFCIQALQDEDLTIYGEGKQTRSFCYVDDLVEGIFRVLQCGHHEPINLGNPIELTIREFAERIIKLSGKNLKLAFRPLPQDDPKTRCPDIRKAKELLQWAPKVDLESGLKRTYEYFRSQVNK